jgi:hypothetical protein
MRESDFKEPAAALADAPLLDRVVGQFVFVAAVRSD